MLMTCSEAVTVLQTRRPPPAFYEQHLAAYSLWKMIHAGGAMQVCCSVQRPLPVLAASFEHRREQFADSWRAASRDRQHMHAGRHT